MLLLKPKPQRPHKPSRGVPFPLAYSDSPATALLASDHPLPPLKARGLFLGNLSSVEEGTHREFLQKTLYKANRTPSLDAHSQCARTLGFVLSVVRSSVFNVEKGSPHRSRSTQNLTSTIGSPRQDAGNQLDWIN